MAEEGEKKKRKGIIQEFKEFITRGNVLDLAIGIIIGGAFTAIVTALCDNVLRPVINWILSKILGSGTLENIYTVLVPAYTYAEDGVTKVLDLANSVYIDWGLLISAIINFLLIATILFVIIKVINKLREAGELAKESIESAAKKRKEERLKAQEAEKEKLPIGADADSPKSPSSRESAEAEQVAENDDAPAE